MPSALMVGRMFTVALVATLSAGTQAAAPSDPGPLRRWLESLVRDPSRLPEPLTGWRHERVARPLPERL